MNVTVVLPDDIGNRLERDAVNAGMPLSLFLADRIQMLDRARPIADRIGDLVCAGWSDPLIAEELSYSLERVRVIRRALGLKPNRTHVRRIPVDKSVDKPPYVRHSGDLRDNGTAPDGASTPVGGLTDIAYEGGDRL